MVAEAPVTTRVHPRCAGIEQEGCDVSTCCLECEPETGSGRKMDTVVPGPRLCAMTGNGSRWPPTGAATIGIFRIILLDKGFCGWSSPGRAADAHAVRDRVLPPVLGRPVRGIDRGCRAGRPVRRLRPTDRGRIRRGLGRERTRYGPREGPGPGSRRPRRDQQCEGKAGKQSLSYSSRHLPRALVDRRGGRGFRDCEILRLAHGTRLRHEQTYGGAGPTEAATSTKI